MPYIDQNRRNALDEGRAQPQTAADLDYVFSRILDKYHVDNGVRFEKIAEVIAALESTKLEYYRRVAAPYERLKAMENGDVYTVDVLEQTRQPRRTVNLRELVPPVVTPVEDNSDHRVADTAESVQSDQDANPLDGGWS